MGERAAGTDGGPSLRLGGLRSRHGGRRARGERAMAAGYPPPSPSPPSLFSMPASSATTVETMAAAVMAAAVEAARDLASLPRRPCGEERPRLADRGAARRRGEASAGQAR